MAEVFGAVASGIGIAGVAAQAIDGIRKLQAFCNDIRDAPEEVKYLTTELEILLGTIASIEAQIQRNSTICGNMDPTPALRFVDQSVRSLNTVIEKLNAEIAQKRKMGSMKMAWKKKVLESHLIKIERSKTSLSLAVTAYSTELYLQATMRTDTRIDQLSMNMSTLAISSQTRLMPTPDPRTDDTQQIGSSQQLRTYEDGYCEEIRKRPRASRLTPVLSFSLILPSWLAQYSLQISLCRAARSWNLNLRPYREVTRDSFIWTAIQYGDFDWFRDLIESGQATVFDRLDSGWTLLHELAICASPHDRETFSRIARFLLDRGADVNEAGFSGSLAIHNYSCKNILYPLKSNTDLREDVIFRLLLEGVDMDPSSFWEAFASYSAINTTFADELKCHFPLDTMEYPFITMADRLHTMLCGISDGFSPRELAYYLDLESFETAYPALDDDLKRDVLCVILRQWGCCSGYKETISEEWGKTIRGLLAAGATFEVFRSGEEREETPQEAKEGRSKDQAVIEAIHQFAAPYAWAKARYHDCQHENRGFVVGFQHFISRTKYLGIKLEATTSCKRFEFCLEYEFLVSCGPHLEFDCWEPYVFSLYYDDGLSTWVMWDSMYETYCSEFWDLIDHPERTMPGTWID